MRTIRFAVVCLLMVSAGLHSGAQLSERDAAKLAKEYVSEKTDDARRAEILAELKNTDPLLLQRTLKKSIKDDDERLASFALATEMRVPGLSDAAWKYIDEHEAPALDYLARMMESGTPKQLTKMWESSAAGESRFNGISERLQKHWLPLEFASAFRDALDDEARGEAALAILRFQLNAPEATPEELKKDWNERLRALEDDARVFETKGRPLLELPVELQGATPVRQNHRLQARKVVYLSEFPPDWSTRSFTIRLRVRPDKASDIVISFMTKDQNQTASFNYKPGRWFIEFTTGESAEVKLAGSEWAELELRVVNHGDEKNPDQRRCHLLVNGEELKLKGIYYTLNAPLRRFSIDLARTDETALLGGAEWWYDK